MTASSRSPLKSFAAGNRRSGCMPAALTVKIERIEAIAVSLPLLQPIKRSKGVLTTADNVLVRIEAGGGGGWGGGGGGAAGTGGVSPREGGAGPGFSPFPP